MIIDWIIDPRSIAPDTIDSLTFQNQNDKPEIARKQIAEIIVFFENDMW